MVRRTKAEAEKTRSQILDAAEDMFLEMGVTRTSLEVIARKADVTRGAVYWHFRNKSDLIDAMFDRVRMPQDDMILEIASGEMDHALDLIEETTLSVFNALTQDEHRQRVFTILMHRIEGRDARTEGRQIADRKILEKFIRCFEIAAEQGALAPAWPAKTAAYATWMMVLGLMREWLESPESFDLTEVGNGCVRQLFHSFRHSS